MTRTWLDALVDAVVDGVKIALLVSIALSALTIQWKLDRLTAAGTTTVAKKGDRL